MRDRDPRSQRRRHQVVGLVVAMFAATAMADVVSAQRPVGRNFEANAPAVGELMPDVAVYDRDGTEHRLRDLLGERYTVLILGCLT